MSSSVVAVAVVARLAPARVSSSSRRASSARCSATSDDPRAAAAPTTRRQAVFSAAALSAAALFGAPRDARAVRYQQVCDPTEAGAECRAALISGDQGELGDYETKSAKKFEAAKASTNPDLTNYQKDTLTLVDEMEEVLALDVYDLTREKRISQLKKDGNVWAGKYAPGGSAKTASGRAFYNAINQVSGHFNANGIAPLPASRLAVVNDNISKTRELIDQGR